MSSATAAVVDLRDRLSPRLKHSFALALWYALNLLTLIALFGYGLPDFANGAVTHPSAAEVFVIFSRKLASWLPGSLPAAVLAATTALTGLLWLLSSVFVALVDRLSLRDTSRAAGSAISWSARNYFGSGILWLSIAPLAAITLVAKLLPDADWTTLIAVSIPLVTATLIVPVLTLNADCLGGERSGRISNLRWSGLANTLLFLGIFVITIAIDGLLSAAPWSHWSYAAIAGLAYYPIDIIATGTAFAIVIASLPFSLWGSELKRRTSLRFIAAWLILDAHWMVVIAWIIPPLLVGQLLLVYVVPQYLVTLDAIGQHPTGLFDLARYAAEGLSAYFHVLLWPCMTMVCMASGRFLTRIDAESSVRLP